MDDVRRFSFRAVTALLAAFTLLVTQAHAAVTLAEQAEPYPGVQVTTSYAYYDLTGATADDLKRQIGQLGPRDPSGPWTASTSWGVRWSYGYLATPEACGVDTPRTEVSVTFTLPRWIAPEAASPSLLRTWDAYMNAVMVHESGHRDLAAQAGYEVLQVIQALPAMVSCEELDQAAQAVAEGVVGRYRQLQTEYDRATEHGVVQGAIFR